jgi:hypothetical protein
MLPRAISFIIDTWTRRWSGPSRVALRRFCARWGSWSLARNGAAGEDPTPTAGYEPLDQEDQHLGGNQDGFTA